MLRNTRRNALPFDDDICYFCKAPVTYNDYWVMPHGRKKAEHRIWFHKECYLSRVKSGGSIFD